MGAMKDIDMVLMVQIITQISGSDSANFIVHSFRMIIFARSRCKTFKRICRMQWN